MPLKSRTGVLVKRPALGAVIAGRFRPVERAFALAPVEAAEVAARQRHPHDALAVDVGAADAEARHRHVVDLRERRLRRIRSRNEPHDSARIGPERAPDRAVHRTRHHGVEARDDPLVLGGIDRLIRLDVLVALAVAVGVEDERRPALRLRHITRLVEHLGVDPADHRPAAAGPQRLVGVVAELQMMGPEAGVDERVLSRLGIEHRELAVRPLHREDLGRGMIGALLAEVRVVRRREPSPRTRPVPSCRIMPLWLLALVSQIFSSPQ